MSEFVKVIYKIIKLVLTVLILATLFITCPTKEQHVKQVQESYHELHSSVLEKLVSPAVDLVIEDATVVYNLGLFSLGFYRTDDGLQPMTVGIFSRVFCFNPDLVKP